MKARFCPSSDNYFVKNADCFASRRYSLKNKLGDWMIKQYWTWSSQNIMICQYLADQYNYHFICLSLWLWQIINLLTTDKSWYFAQPRPIIVNSQNWGRREELLSSWEGIAWEIFHFQPIVSMKFDRYCICHRISRKQSSSHGFLTNVHEVQRQFLAVLLYPIL